jgi:hypothetical protein
MFDVTLKRVQLNKALVRILTNLKADEVKILETAGVLDGQFSLYDILTGENCRLKTKLRRIVSYDTYAIVQDEAGAAYIENMVGNKTLSFFNGKYDLYEPVPETSFTSITSYDSTGIISGAAVFDQHGPKKTFCKRYSSDGTTRTSVIAVFQEGLLVSTKTTVETVDGDITTTRVTMHDDGGALLSDVTQSCVVEKDVNGRTLHRYVGPDLNGTITYFKGIVVKRAMGDGSDFIANVKKIGDRFLMTEKRSKSCKEKIWYGFKDGQVNHIVVNVVKKKKPVLHRHSLFRI